MPQLRLLLPAALLAAASGSLAAQDAAQPREQPTLHALATAPSEARLHDTIAHLVGFGTRHTLSDTQSDKRGIGAARRWVKAQFEAISRDCGGCIEVVTPSQTFTGERAPKPVEVMDIVAIKRGSSDPKRVIVMSGHLDSRVSDIMDVTSDAPGANDDASGVAALMEAARLLSKQDNRATLVFAALSGEEQGLYGGKVLADYAVAQGWQVEADLNNDIIGNSRGQNGVRDSATVRVFSEGTRSTETPAQAHRRNYLGGDQVEFLSAGYPAVRVTEAHEDYTRQHQDLRTEGGITYGDTLDGIDLRYLTRVTALNTVTMAALANAPAPPPTACTGATPPRRSGNSRGRWAMSTRPC
ncbi:MAG TPA: M20/M25/M40 family metallo-hydrolase [Rhodanobacteraceae bacterium]|nr:M20/M25/M40 family metallo-hydrolase [Rhodanobacteraceae bacterium]